MDMNVLQSHSYSLLLRTLLLILFIIIRLSSFSTFHFQLSAGRSPIPTIKEEYSLRLRIIAGGTSMALTPSTMAPLGMAAPSFRLPDTEGRMVSLEEFSGAPAALVMFICNHCPYVKHIRKSLAKLAKDYLDKGVAVIGINSNDAVAYPDDSPARMTTGSDPGVLPIDMSGA